MSKRAKFDARILRATCTAAILPVLFGRAVVSAFFGSLGLRGGVDTRDMLELTGAALFVTTLYGVPISFAACFLVGLPIHAVLRRRRWTSLRAYLMAGIASTALPVGVGIFYLVLAGVAGFVSTFFWLALAILGAAGPVAALTFWCLARPDQPVQPAVG
jgi:hypothetical protein